MDPLAHCSDEELADFFRRNKTKISSMEEPRVFLNQLKDNDLIPENLHKKVMKIDCKDKRQEGVYQILEWVEKNQKQSIRVFWRHVFENHILEKNSILRSLKASLLDGSYKQISDAQKPIRKKKNPIQKDKKTPKGEKANKIKKGVEKTGQKKLGESSLTTLNQKKPAKKTKLSLPTSDKNTPSAKKLIKSKQPSIKNQKKTANEKMIAKITKEVLGKMEKKKPGPSSSLISNQKKPAKKVTTATGLKPGKMPKEKKTGIKRKKAGEETEKETPGPSTFLFTNNQMNPAISQTLWSTKIPDAEKLSKNVITADLNQEKKTKEKKTGIKRKKGAKETEEEKPGPSFLFSNNQMKSAMSQTQVPAVSSLKKEEKQDMEDWSWSLYKTQLHVTCGDKAGMLYQEQLAKGKKCILSEGSWYTPSGFEKFAGKGNCKNWKSSIRCQNTTLQKLIEEGHLQAPPTKRRKVEKSQNVLLPSNFSSFFDDESSEDDLEDIFGNVRVQKHEEKRTPVNPSVTVFDDESSEDDLEDIFGNVRVQKHEEKRTPVNPSVTVFDDESSEDDLEKIFSVQKHEEKRTPVNPSVTGKYGKNIPTEDPWVIQKKSVTQEQYKKKSVRCIICHLSEDLLKCSQCPRHFHRHCHLPALKNTAQGNVWMCTYCVLEVNKGIWRAMSKEDALNSPVSKNIMRCEYLLLFLYEKNTQSMFTKDPNAIAMDNLRVTSTPRLLELVKDKLQNNKYKTVQEFVSDVMHIFDNFNSLDMDNRMEPNMSRIFESEFRKVFNIK